MQGISSTLIGYGQGGSGKTHTLLGEGRGLELAELAANSHSIINNDNSVAIDQDPQNAVNSSVIEEEYGVTTHQLSSGLHNNNLDPKRYPNMTAGMIPRLVAHLFDLLYESTANDSTVQFSIRCSYVEIYLDKMTDLLQPGRRESGLRVGRSNCCGIGNEASILGATELCCICPEDIYALLARGQALRTKAAADANIDSNRSHAIFTLHLEQVDKVTGKLSESRLQVLDLACSQSKPTLKVTPNTAASTMEKRMINASLASFHRLVQLKLQQQQQKSLKSSSSTQSPSMSKLAKILQPSIGGMTHTVMICTGSPSSYSIDETIETIRFAQQVQQIKNTPQVLFVGYTQQAYQMQLSLAKTRQKQMIRLIRLIAQECKHGKKKSQEPKNPKVWEAVLQLVEVEKKRNENWKDDKVEKTNDGDNDNLCISIFREKDKEEEIRDLRAKLDKVESELHQEQITREKLESAFRDTRSEVVALKSQNETFVKRNRALDRELSSAKAKINEISTQKIEVEHLLRTIKFRENEAILFLRQLRTFYFRLLMNKAAHGSGTTREVIEEAKKKLPGVADLEDLLDVDKMMVKSGIIESSEIGGDSPIVDYVPSEDALAKSALEARKLEERERDGNQKQYSTSTVPTRSQLIAYRQKILLSPAGVLAIKKEKELENDLLQLSKKCIELQNSLIAEKSMVQALSGRQGAMTKMKQIQETITLKTELERKTNDLLAIVWKMNELHLVNKTIDTQAVMREQQSSYLSEYLSEMQTKNQRLVSQIEDKEKRLKDVNSDLRNQLDGLSLNLWQLGERLEKAPIWRFAVSFSGDFNCEEAIPDRRFSNGNLTEEEINGLIEIVECNG